MGARKTTLWPDEFEVSALSAAGAGDAPTLDDFLATSMLNEPLPWTPSLDCCRTRARRRVFRPALAPTSCAVHPPGPISFYVAVARPRPSRLGVLSFLDDGPPWEEASIEMAHAGSRSHS